MDTRTKSLRRSALYMPALNERAMNKARSINTDVIIFDLEDSVAPEAKKEAREKVIYQLNQNGYGHRELVLRVNGYITPYWEEDLAILKDCQPDAVLVPKVNSAEDILIAYEAINTYSNQSNIGIWLMMETPLAILNARQIAQTAKEIANLQGYVIGTNDLVKDTGVNPGTKRELLWSWLMTLVASAKAYNLDVFDGVYNHLSDDEGFKLEAQQGRDMGMTGKSLIHPKQVDITNEVFAPTDAEIEKAKKIVTAFNQESAKGKGVISVDGKMVERLHLKMAEDVLAKARRIKESS